MRSMSSDKPDPAAFFREMLGQWETIANEVGTGLLKTSEAARTMQSATAATARAKAMGGEMMGRALAAANMPSRDEIVGLSARMAAVEDRLARIETLLERIAGPAAKPDKPGKIKPKRTKTPPKKA